MNKRLIAVFTAFALLYGTCCLRLFDLCVANPTAASGNSGGYTIEVSRIRGDILDCNGEKLVSRDYENVVVAKPTNKALAQLKKVLDTQACADVEQRMKKGNAVSVNIGKLEISNNSDAIMLKKYNRYSENQLARHIIGYLNGEGRGVSGIEKSFDEILFTEKSLTATMKSDVYGRILSGNRIEIRNSNPDVATVELTFDGGIQRAVEDALDIGGIDCGGAVVVEIATGAVRAIASRPNFDVTRLADALNDKNSPLFNRALGAYAVGSVFKVVVAAAALESPIANFTYECKGECEVDGMIFGCNNKTAHGKLDMTKALECSCNTFFVELAEKIGGRKILETASLFGFGQEILLADGIVSKSGTLPSSDTLMSSGALANFSFGQGELTATVLQLAQMMSAVAGSGRYIRPYIIEKVTSSDGTLLQSREKAYPIIAVGEKTAEKLKRMLVSVVENGNAQKARLKNGVTAAGKTATAQTGKFSASGEIYNTWFAGFFPADNPKYTVVILKEGGESGAVDCAPVFKSIADKIGDLEKNS